MMTRADWIACGDDRTKISFKEERELFDAGVISRCDFEFGPHDELGHDTCQETMDRMSEGNPDDTDYSDWYGGERGYDDGLRWSDFV